jgi:[acyl-carrier-protein] S-malonyltransferase
MLEPWLNDETRQELSKWSLQIDLDLERLGTSASSDEIKDTANAQPLIVATSLISAKLLAITNFKIVAGHSVGEIAAVALSGVLSETQALQLVRARGLAMAKAASQSNTGMAAVLGGEKSEVLKTLSEFGLIAANDNGAGQIICN